MFGVIGGSGLYALSDDAGAQSDLISTPFDDQPVTVYKASLGGHNVLFLPRHGIKHDVPPHKVNYRANLLALKESGAERLLAVNVVGGITERMAPGTLVIPDQIIDYTWGRQHTCFDTLAAAENHIDFTWPYDETLRQALIGTARELNYPCIDTGVYGCTQGPRLETAAEIRKLGRDGCDVVGMTGMPEAALARELAIPYACIALVVNWGAGLGSDTIAFGEIAATLEAGIGDIRKVLQGAIKILS